MESYISKPLAKVRSTQLYVPHRLPFVTYSYCGLESTRCNPIPKTVQRIGNGSAAVRFNKLYGLEYDCDIILHSGQVQEEAFYVCDVGDIVHKHREWKRKMPRVEPFYGKTGS